MEIGKDFIAELGLLFEIDNREADVEQRSEENLSITPNYSEACEHERDGTHVEQRLQIGNILLLAPNKLKN